MAGWFSHNATDDFFLPLSIIIANVVSLSLPLPSASAFLILTCVLDQLCEKILPFIDPPG